jgi:hypothetical protein
MWPVQVARKARTTEGCVAKLAQLAVQIAELQPTFHARLRRGQSAQKSLISAENDSAGHNNNLDAPEFTAASSALAGQLNRQGGRIQHRAVLCQDLRVWPAQSRLIHPKMGKEIAPCHQETRSFLNPTILR